MTSATLYGYGRMSWPQARTLLADATCAWTDLDGSHLGNAPDTAPVGASHLWGWTGNWCARLRFDGDAVYVGILGEPEPSRPTGDTVTVTVRTDLKIWASGDLQAGPVEPRMIDHTWELLEMTGAQPITFVRARPARP